ncbi:MAG: DeoR family transcriptional regulator [Patescibacteria group bacterium]|nr:DeoR family transcriptional regulator [Patescibacteria group bacterium]
MSLHARQIEVLKAVILQYRENGIPVGSKCLDFDVSSATIRNDMSRLEQEGLIVKPHTSAGRVPTLEGYRLFVNNFVEEGMLVVRSGEEEILLDEDNIYQAISSISQKSNSIAFAVLDNNTTYYLGISHLLSHSDFRENLENTSELISLLETKHVFAKMINEIEIQPGQIRIFVGLEKVLPVHINCSMMAVQFSTQNISGVIGVLGSVHMDYFQIAQILKEEIEKLQGGNTSPVLLNPGVENI